MVKNKKQEKKRPLQRNTNAPSTQAQSSRKFIFHPSELELFSKRIAALEKSEISKFVDTLNETFFDRSKQFGIQIHQNNNLLEEIQNAHSLIKERGVPKDGFQLIETEDEFGLSIKLEMNESVIQYLCNIGAVQEEEENADNNGHINGVMDHNNSLHPTFTTSSSNLDPQTSNNFSSGHFSIPPFNFNGENPNQANLFTISDLSAALTAYAQLSMNMAKTKTDDNNPAVPEGEKFSPFKEESKIPRASWTNIIPTPIAKKETSPIDFKQAHAEKELGNIAYKKRNFSQALNHYSMAIKMDPNVMVYWLNRAAVHYEMGNYYNCVVDCQSSLFVAENENEKDEKNEKGDNNNKLENEKSEVEMVAKAHSRMGQARFKLQHFEYSIQSFKKVLLLSSDATLRQKAKDAINESELYCQAKKENEQPNDENLNKKDENEMKKDENEMNEENQIKKMENASPEEKKYQRTFITPSSASLKVSMCVYCKDELQEATKYQCPSCNLYLYCSSSHQLLDWTTHRNACAQLRIYVDDEYGTHPPLFVTLSDQYRKLKLKDWESYFETRCIKIGGQQDRSKRMLSDTVTYPLTIVYAMRQIHFQANKARPIFICILGVSSGEEILEPEHWRELSLFDPTLQYCVYLVGPALSQAKHGQSLKVSDKIQVWYWRDFYHNFRTHQFTTGAGISRAGTLDPDIFVLCNSGVGSGLTLDWMPSLSPILFSNAPAIFTSWTDDEMKRDSQLLSSLNAKFVMQPEFNPFATQRYKPSVITPNIMYKGNMYIFIVQGFTGNPPEELLSQGVNAGIRMPKGINPPTSSLLFPSNVSIKQGAQNATNSPLPTHPTSMKVTSTEFAQQWEDLMTSLNIQNEEQIKKKNIVVHLPLSLLGPFIKSPKTTMPSLWSYFEQDANGFIQFAEFNRKLHLAKIEQLHLASITFRTDGLDREFCLIPVHLWETPCFQCGDKGMLCCKRCGTLWYCTIDCRRRLHNHHKLLCKSTRDMTPEMSDMLVFEDVAQNQDVMQLLYKKLPTYFKK